jgi:hypothetical protein
VSLYDLLSVRGMTVLDRAEAHPAEAAAVRPVLDPARRAELRAALLVTFAQAREYFGSGVVGDG